MSAVSKPRSRAYINATNKNWQSGKTLMFVKVYKHHSCLWDPSNGMYKSQTVRSAAYKALADQFDMTVSDVKSKIKNLRATYFQEIRKINDSRYSGDGSDIYKPTLVWFDEMGSFIKAGAGSSLLSGVVKSSLVEEKDSNSMEESLLEDSIVVKDEPLLDFSDSESTTTTTFPQPSPQPDHAYQTTSKKHKTQQPSRIPPPSASSLVYELNGDQSPFDPPDFQDDEFEVFGKHVACQLRQLGIYRALKVQAKIQLMLSRERAKDFQEKSQNQQQQQQQQHTSSAGSVAGGSEHGSSFGIVEHLGGASGVSSVASGLNSPDTNHILFQPVDDEALEEFAQL